MLKYLYKLPKFLLAILVISGAIVFILLDDPPHTLCETQIQHFKVLQIRGLYRNPRDVHKEKSRLRRSYNLCLKEQAPGVCYEYFAILKKLLKDFNVLTDKCIPLIYSTPEVQSALNQALTLMTALAWREDVLTGQVSKYNWLNRSDLFLFCEVQRKYIMYYGQQNYKNLENQILSLLPMKTKVSRDTLLRRTILSESCAKYR